MHLKSVPSIFIYSHLFIHSAEMFILCLLFVICPPMAEKFAELNWLILGTKG